MHPRPSSETASDPMVRCFIGRASQVRAPGDVDSSMLRRLLPAVAVAAALTCAPSAHAAITSVLDGKVPCTAREGVRFCEGGTDHLVPSFDGATLDVNVTLPATGDHFPVIGIYHGWGGSKLSFAATKAWAQRGYAVFTMSDRGWGDSCGGQSSTRTSDGCKTGYNHLMDTRYEVRDSQEL